MVSKDSSTVRLLNQDVIVMFYREGPYRLNLVALLVVSETLEARRDTT